MDNYPKQLIPYLKECQEYGIQFGREMGIMLRKYKPLLTKYGNSSNINFTKDEYEEMSAEMADTFVHSHPASPSVISMADIYAGNQFNVAVYAITNRGDVFWFNRCKDIHKMIEIHSIGRSEYYLASMMLSFPSDAPSLAFHKYLIEARDIGLIDYQFNITKETEKDIDLIVSLLNDYRCKH